MSILEALKADDYKIGSLQAVVYDRKRTELFPAGFLSQLYFAFLGSRYSNKGGVGILQTMLCGFNDLSHDSVLQFWLKTPLVILGEWKGSVFTVAGVCGPSMMIGAGEEERACYGFYGFIRAYWGSDEQEVLALLGISVLFQEMQLKALHGSRFETNDLTAKFMARFGFKDVATLPAQMTRNGKLVSAVISTLSRETFEAYVERQALETYLAGK